MSAAVVRFAGPATRNDLDRRPAASRSRAAAERPVRIVLTGMVVAVLLAVLATFTLASLGIGGELQRGTLPEPGPPIHAVP